MPIHPSLTMEHLRGMAAPNIAGPRARGTRSLAQSVVAAY